MSDLISRADAIEAVRKELVCDGRHEAHDKTCRFIADVLLSALPSAETTGALDDAIAKYVADGLMELPSAEAVTHDLRTETHGRVLDGRAETIKELGEWLEQMIQHGVPSHSAKRKALATAIALLSAEAVQGDGRNNIKRYPNCQMRTSLGNCDAIGGFCTSINAPICDAFHKLTEAVQGWIPCSERLPEDIRPVLVTWKNIDPASYYQYIVGKHFIGTAHYYRGKWYWYSSTTEDMLAEYGRYDFEEFDEAIECIAWMPLPKPYKGGEDDNA